MLSIATTTSYSCIESGAVFLYPIFGAGCLPLEQPQILLLLHVSESPQSGRIVLNHVKAEASAIPLEEHCVHAQWCKTCTWRGFLAPKPQPFPSMQLHISPICGAGSPLLEQPQILLLLHVFESPQSGRIVMNRVKNRGICNPLEEHCVHGIKPPPPVRELRKRKIKKD